MPYTLAPYEQRQYLDDDGNPLAGGKITTYRSGTSTPAVTYSDSIGTFNTNPIVLNASGRCIIYLDALAYKFVLTDADDVPVGYPNGTIDPVTSTAVGSGSGIASIFAFGGNGSSPVTETTYPSGAGIDKLHPGTAVYSADSANLVGTYALQATGVMDTAGTLSIALVNLSDGSPDTPLVACTITSLTGDLSTSGSIIFSSPGTTKLYGIKCKVTANTGFAWGMQLIRTA